MAAACKRLVQNAIVCWNYLYLSQRIAEERDPEKRQAMLESIAAGSVVSWDKNTWVINAQRKEQIHYGVNGPKVSKLSA